MYAVASGAALCGSSCDVSAVRQVAVLFVLGFLLAPGFAGGVFGIPRAAGLLLQQHRLAGPTSRDAICVLTVFDRVLSCYRSVS